MTEQEHLADQERWAPRDGARLRIQIRIAIRQAELASLRATSSNQISALAELDNALVDLREALSRVLP